MSRPINITDVVNLITPTHNSISKFIFNTLGREYKLSCPDEQSEYFRWGLRNHEKYYQRSIIDYGKIRKEFNEWTVDKLIAAKDEEERILREKIRYAHPLFARAIMRGACISRIAKYNDYLTVKSITATLPPWEELKSDPELLRRILTMQ